MHNEAPSDVSNQRTNPVHDGREPISRQPSKPFHVLALSGGGFRGLYTATVLKHLEEHFGAPLARHFDLICGTSAGGLLALGLGCEFPAGDLQTQLEREGRRIFASRSLIRRWLGPWVMAKHSASGLHAVLREQFQDRTIGDLKHRVLIPAVSYSKGSGYFFKTPHAPQFSMDVKRSLVDVGLATTAAPTYFPIHQIGDEGAFVDGGLVGNSPGFFGLHEAHNVLGIPREVGAVRVLSIGTMTLGATKRGASGLDWGYSGWKTRIFDLLISAQEHSVDSMLAHVLGECYLRIDDLATPEQSKDIADLDIVTPAAIEVLKTRGTLAARSAIGKPALAPFRNHIADTPTFFFGPNAANKDTYAQS